jgi:hypothetical protein
MRVLRRAQALHQQVSAIHFMPTDFDGLQRATQHSEQENERTQESSNVDYRTEHEIYVALFLRSVVAGLTSVMCPSISSTELTPARTTVR